VKIQILVVDDEADFRDTMIVRLNKRNLGAKGAESGESALEMIRSERFDVIILDLKMRGMGGILTLREIKKCQPLIEVILLTGHGSAESSIECMELGAYDYLLKPYDFEMLLEKIQLAYTKKAVREQKIRILRNLSANPRNLFGPAEK
jgi:DNA-binding NtrC family response regulator